MSTAHVTTAHQERMAYVYVRQSTLWQVSEHQESTERQYRLQERALNLGWPPTAIEVIDEDQGRSGSSATARTGFQRLVSEVSLGQVGIVLMLEASRLARNSSDWHRLIELCGLSHTGLSDESAIYDPRDPNDRLLLGVKGTLSEAELFTLRTRLYEGRWNKARKGLLQFPLPVGYVRAPDGAWDLDPDQQVRERLAYLFEAFGRQGSALLQGIVWCGHCGRKMGVQHHASKEKRSATSICQLGHQQDGEDTICQSMTARPVDAAVVQAFLEAVSPVGLEVAVAVLDHVEQQLLDLRRQRELQLEQARYEARLAQRKYDAVDPDNRLVAASLERRWNAQLTRVAELEQAFAKAEQEASFTLTPEERVAMQTLAQDLSARLPGGNDDPCRSQAIAAFGD
jgi:DNA invertase Pin-like site-specific DNA recombinase